MMHMGSMFPGLGMVLVFFLIPTVLVALFFGIRHLRGPMGGSRRSIAGGESSPRHPEPHSIQRKIMQLARENEGVLTVTDVVLSTSLSIKEAEATLNDMVDGFRIKMDVADSGIVRYEFIELQMSRKGDRDQ